MMPIEEGSEAPPTIGESLGAALAEVEANEGTQTTETVLETPAPVRGRDPAGRFATRTADAPAHIQAPQPPAAPVGAPVAPGAPAAAPVEVDAAPTSWKDEEKAEWARLPPGAKAAIQRREREVTQGLQRAAESRKFGDSVYQEVAPYMEILRSEGATPVTAIKTLLETAYALRYGSNEHKRALMLSLVQQYGIDFSTPVDPSRAALERELDTRRHADMRRTADVNTRVEQEALTEVEEFARQPGREDMPVLRDHMVALLNSGAAKDLPDAYEQAAWAHPQVRSKMQMQENVQRNQNLTRNRNAASSVTGNPGNVTVEPAADPKNLRATLETAFSAGRL